MDFQYNTNFNDLFLDSLKELSLQEQNDLLQQKVKELMYDNKELLRHIGFLNTQISKYTHIHEK